jgi:hypothetical protein
VRELRDAPKAAGVVDLSGVVVTGLSEVFDATAEKQQAALAGLVVRLAAEGVVKGAELLKGLAHYTEGLEDLRCGRVHWFSGGFGIEGLSVASCSCVRGLSSRL